MAETSIVFKANDQISGAMRSMLGNSQALNKQFEVLEKRVGQLSKKNDAINKSFASVSAQALEAKKALKEAETAFKRTGDEESRLNFENAKKQYKDLTDAAKAYEAASKSTRRSMQETQEQMRKLGTENGGSGAAGSGSSLGSLASGLMQAGLFKIGGDALAKAADAAVGSALGSVGGSLVSGTLSGAASGAALGSVIPGLGTLAGAAIGGAAGLLTSGTQALEQKDDSFKNYVQDAVQGQLDQRNADIQSGSALMSQRETDEIAFAKLLGGADISKDYLAKVRDMANHTPFLYSDLTSMSKSLAPAFGSDPERMLELMQAIGDAGASVGLDTSGMQMVGTAISRMESTGKTTLEYLNILQERGIDAYGFLADGLSKSKEQMLEMVSKGLIPGAEAAKLIQEGMEGAYHGAMELQSQTFGGLSSTLEGMQENQSAAYGEGYNQERSKGLTAEIDYLSGIGGQRQQEANRAIGAWQASLENAKEKAIRDAVTNAMNSNAYREAQATDDAAKMGEIIARARIQGQNAYNASEGAQLALESEKSLISNVRADASLHGDYYDAGYELGEEFSRGVMAGKLQNQQNTFGPTEIRGVTSGTSMMEDQQAWLKDYKSSHAFGLRRVPETGVYLLHEGESVRTAAETRGASGGDVINLNIYGLTVRQDSDLTAIAAGLFQMLEAAKRRAEG